MQFIRMSCHIRRVFALLWSEFRLLKEEDTDMLVVFVCVRLLQRDDFQKRKEQQGKLKTKSRKDYAQIAQVFAF